MTPYHFIMEKRNGGTHDPQALREFVTGFAVGRIPDYQMAAWMMAVWFRGMNAEECEALTRAMVESGDRIDLSAIPGVKVDKHSTGGVGDTTTLVLAPLAAAAGARVAKMSGRGLGHTGGTLDKLESIPGLRVDLSAAEFVEQVRRIGLAVISPTGDLVPADGKMYALRDVTATVDSIPLIASSIMSKKLACGADAILLDVKFGSGAFMETAEDALALAQTMVELGKRFGRRVRAVLSGMDQPLGSCVGNALEVREALEILRRERRETPLEQVGVELASQLLELGGLAPDLPAARVRVREILESGRGLARFREMVEAQGGEGRVVEDLSLLPSAPLQRPVEAPRGGWLVRQNAERVGRAALLLGSGRRRKGDPVDPAVGLVLERRVGDPVEPGQTLAVLHARREEDLEPARAAFLEAVEIGPEPPPPKAWIHQVVE